MAIACSFSKKQETSERDLVVMRRAIQEAKKGSGKTAPNPSVGAIIVRAGNILSTGYHSAAGQAHAEIEALGNLPPGVTARGGTLYVTLEPCSTTGKTPPCTEAIIHAGFARVVYGATDPNRAHQGSAQKILEQAGIEVTTGVLAQECEKLNHHWNHRMKTELPWVIAKCGMSLDGRISSHPERRWITSLASRRDAMLLRAQVEAILVGGGTIRDDNPSLTVRGLSKKRSPSHQPWRIIWSLSGNIPPTAHVFTDEYCDRTCVVIGTPLQKTLRDLAARGISSVLIEGGGRTLGEAFDQQLVDEVRFYMAPLLLGGPVPALARIFHTDRDEEAAKPGGARQNVSLTQHPSVFPASAVDQHEISGLGGTGIPDGVELQKVSYRMVGEDLVISGLMKKQIYY